MTDRADVRWDLSSIYTGFDDPAIAAEQDESRALADTFVRAYRGRVARLDGPGLLAAIREYETITRLSRRYGRYASLRFAVQSDSADARAHQAAAQTFAAELGAKLVFFGLELKDLPPDHLDALGADDALRRYAHYLAYQRVFQPYSLPEPAEATISRKDVTGKNAWVQLYLQITSGLRFTVGDDRRELTESDLGPLFESPDRSLREAAATARHAGYSAHADVLTFVFNTLFEDHRSEMEARGYPDVTRFTVLHDDLDPAVMTALIDAVTARQDLPHRYEALRKRVLGLDDYATHDRSVSLFGEQPPVPWDDARAQVLDAFEAFSPRVADVARTFFDERRIDAFPRPGKSAGGFCSPGFPPELPFVLMNYTGTTRDRFTLAHELGHAMHFALARVQSPVNYFTGMPLAETASVFAELLLQKHLLEGADDDARRRLLDRQVRGAMGTAWAQIAFVRWEMRAHARRAEGVATGEDYCALWEDEMRALWGDAVALHERDRWNWVRIPHFVFARFYCYSYAFGKLLTLALYGVWQERGDAFVDDYIALLEAGGSRSPRDLLADLGLDLADPDFWRRGVAVVEEQLAELEALADA